MADLADPSRPELRDGPGGGARRGSPAGAPRWVKMLAAAGLVLVAVAVVVALARGGSHGLARHAPLGNPADRVPPASGSDGRAPSGNSSGHLPPAGSHR